MPNIEVIPYDAAYLVKIEVYTSSLRPHFKRGEGKLKSTYIRIGSTTRLADQDLRVRNLLMKNHAMKQAMKIWM